MIGPPLRSCLGIPISDQIAQRCGNSSVIVAEKRLNGRGPLGLTITAVKVCAAVIFYCSVFASVAKPSTHTRVRKRTRSAVLNDACQEQSGCCEKCRKCGTGATLFELLV
ncbi:hypothetical protein SAMN05421881_103623 [Nitrosomonas halophila]|uniref:Uncharacterized protein n=1 Tax=Nitrosomonas halophila TaxID=44576 RepID=A0A1H3JYN9_9PROT|nr:hypothetical protein SAMN05421881_103623 [Nitrosomonas halophila]